MIKNIKFKSILLLVVSIILLCSNLRNISAAPVSDIKLIVDGKDITSLSSPVIENDRALVPIRFVAESLGAEVTWNGQDRTVTIKRGSNRLFLKIDSRVVEYNDGAFYNISDVAPKIINDRTYVPVRLISNAFAIGIDWDGNSRTVYIDSSKTSQIQHFYDVEITSLSDGEEIAVETEITLETDTDIISSSGQVMLLLLDRETFTGFVVASGPASEKNLLYSPRPVDNGRKILAAAYYDTTGEFIGGTAIAVNINIDPTVSISGIKRYQIIKDTTDISSDFNFKPAYISYQIETMQTGLLKTYKEKDPRTTLKWTPTWEQRGINYIKATAYDSTGKAYESELIPVIVSVTHNLNLTGVSHDATIDKPVTLYASRNFDVDYTQFYIRDVSTGRIKIIGELPYGGFTWFPGPDEAGEKDIFAKVLDTSGVFHQSKLVRVNVQGTPKVQIKGIGPSQVLTSGTVLDVQSNIEFDNIKYVLTDVSTGTVYYLNPDSDTTAKTSLTPSAFRSGNYKIYAEAYYQDQKITSKTIYFSIYNDKIFGPAAIIPKDEFLGFASSLAVDSMEITGMSAALQTAQAILETGWGQSVPVDKYSGKFSNNLFGIKGSANNGSVTSDTWEIFNGIYYRVDADFRAYDSVTDGWDDHKGFLLDLSRYEGFREVMYDSFEGAWALKRAGYATDPLYAIKLIRIIDTYDLRELDRTGL